MVDQGQVGYALANSGLPELIRDERIWRDVVKGSVAGVEERPSTDVSRPRKQDVMALAGCVWRWHWRGLVEEWLCTASIGGCMDCGEGLQTTE